MSAPPRSLDAAKLELKTNRITIYKRVRRAYELLEGAPYTPEGRQKILINKMEKFDQTLKLCDQCENKTCKQTKIICQKMDDYFKRTSDVSFVGKTMKDFNAYSDHKTFLNWQIENKTEE